MGKVAMVSGSFKWDFILFALFGFMNIILAGIYVPYKTKSELEIKSGDLKFSQVCKVITKPKLLFFNTNILIMGAAVALVERLLFVFV